jgi:hypothetical protein
MGLPPTEAVNTATSSHEENMLEDHVQRVVQSPQFLRAETSKKLLLYLWANRNREISEYAVATEALGRRADFDPKTDASVRVQISRLRSKLKDFYECEGAGEACALYIPMGTHTITILESESQPSTPIDTDAVHPPISHIQYVRVLFIISWVALVMLSSWLLWGRYIRGGPPQRPLEKATSFWATFIGSGTPVKIILPSPVFFGFSKLPKLIFRDIDVNTYQDWQASGMLKSLQKTGGGPPALNQFYTVASDTLAAIGLARYMESAGVADLITFDVSSDTSMGVFEKANVIALGGYSTLYAFRDYLASMDFTMGPGEAWVTNAHPTAGESLRYAVYDEGSGHVVAPAIIAVLPGRVLNRRLLLLQSRHTDALVLLLTSEIGEALFEKMYAAHGSPTYFEMVVEYERYNGQVVRFWPVAMHAYTKDAPVGVAVTP